jgi:hypothetical protein
MIEVKDNFLGGLDLDNSPFLIAENAYVDALNITRDAVVGFSDKVITSVAGNQKVSYNYPSGNAKYIGFYSNILRRTVIGFRWHSQGYHGIYEFNVPNRVITKIFENLTDTGGVDVLQFTQSGKITSINVFNRNEGDLLFFLDSLGRPTKLDIGLFKAGTYTPVTRNVIDVALDWPNMPISGTYANDNTQVVNNLLNKLFKFQYIWVYDDFTETCGSPESAVALPLNILDPTFTNQAGNNVVINLSLSSGSKKVKQIKILMSFSEKSNLWNDYRLVATLNKSKQGIADNVTFVYQFYNDGTYPVFDVARRIQLFDDVPLFANAQEMPNGNTLIYGGITEGYNNDLVPNVNITIGTVAIGSGGAAGNLFESHSISDVGGTETLQEVFSGTPTTGTVITIRVNGGNVIIANYTTNAGDTTQQVVNGLYGSAIAIGIAAPSILNSTTINFAYPWPTYVYYSTTITPPAVLSDTNSIASWPFFNQRNLGLVYFDQKGITNGVLYSAKIQFPNYNEDANHKVLAPFIDAKIYHVPPVWAYSYGWVITHDDSNYLYIQTMDANSSENDYIYFDITNLGLTQTKNTQIAGVVSWTFQSGDRMRLIKRINGNIVFGPSYDTTIIGIVVAPIINGAAQTGKTFVKVRKTFPFNTENYSNKYYVIQLYRPAQPQANVQNLPFYEFGENYPILNPGTAQRIHAGSFNIQSTDYTVPAECKFYSGDSYIRPRTMYIQDVPNIVLTSFYVQDKNFVDFYFSAVNSLNGRPNVIDPNTRQAYYSTLVRFSQNYDPDTNVNRTNRFLAANFDQYDYSYGDIQRMKTKDRFIRIYQKFKIGSVPIFSKLGRNSLGDQITIVTDNLINPINYYEGDYGIGDAKESLSTFGFADYFCDTNKGTICRVSLDGIVPISVLYKANSFSTINIPLRTGTYKIYGGFDQRLNNYVISLEATPTSPAATLTFNEETNSFESFISMPAEFFTSMGTLLISANNGDIYTHDNPVYNTFYGVLYDSTISFVFNQDAILKKTWISITEAASGIWDCPLIKTNSYSYGNTVQQTSLIQQDFDVYEGMPMAAIKRDANSTGGKYNGSILKGNYALIKFRKPLPATLENLSLISVKSIVSQLNPT